MEFIKLLYCCQENKPNLASAYDAMSFHFCFIAACVKAQQDLKVGWTE